MKEQNFEDPRDYIDAGERICTCGSLTNKDELMSCAICSKDTCPFCSINISTLMCDTLSEETRRYILYEMKGKTGQELCPSCLEKYKIKFIMQIPVQKLPLYINENWGSDKASRAYKARLAGESIIEA